MIYARPHFALLLGKRTSLILTSLAGIMRAVLNVQDLQGRTMVAINVDVERMLRFRLQGCLFERL